MKVVGGECLDLVSKETDKKVSVVGRTRRALYIMLVCVCASGRRNGQEPN